MSSPNFYLGLVSLNTQMVTQCSKPYLCIAQSCNLLRIVFYLSLFLSVIIIARVIAFVKHFRKFFLRQSAQIGNENYSKICAFCLLTFGGEVCYNISGSGDPLGGKREGRDFSRP